MEEIILIVSIVLARIAEAYKDAEAFEKPTENRSLIWHLLKFIQYPLWSVAGYFLFGVERVYIWIPIAVGFSWIAFEYFLKKFRASYYK